MYVCAISSLNACVLYCVVEFRGSDRQVGWKWRHETRSCQVALRTTTTDRRLESNPLLSGECDITSSSFSSHQWSFAVLVDVVTPASCATCLFTLYTRRRIASIWCKLLFLVFALQCNFQSLLVVDCRSVLRAFDRHYHECDCVTDLRFELRVRRRHTCMIVCVIKYNFANRLNRFDLVSPRNRARFIE